MFQNFDYRNYLLLLRAVPPEASRRGRHKAGKVSLIPIDTLEHVSTLNTKHSLDILYIDDLFDFLFIHYYILYIVLWQVWRYIYRVIELCILSSNFVSGLPWVSFFHSPLITEIIRNFNRDLNAN